MGGDYDWHYQKKAVAFRGRSLDAQVPMGLGAPQRNSTFVSDKVMTIG
jgi:hypothetical protein